MKQKLERFKEYLNRYQKLVMVNAGKFVDYQTAEDVAQETFLKMLEHMDYLEEDTVKQWLIVVSGNIAKDYLRKSGRTRLTSMESKEQELLLGQWGESAEQCFEKEEKRKAAGHLLETACNLLYEKNPTWYYILVDSCLLGLTSARIADALGLSSGHVDVLKFRARAYLKKHLGKEYESLL